VDQNKIILPNAADLKLWTHILFSVSCILPGDLPRIAIAGGCLRDTLLGKPVADIDVFHEGELTETHGLTSQPLLDLPGEYDSPVAIWNGDCFGMPVQLIQVESLAERLQEFSCTLSQVYFMDGELRMTPQFLHSVRDKTLKFAHWCRPAYRAKITAKFPDYKILS
jgi:hypothetical protein